MSTKAKTGKTAGSTLNSVELQAVLKRVKSSELDSGDKTVLVEILNQNIKLKKLVEKSTEKFGGKGVIARLPNGFDIVK